jgi:hypothetical protein
MVLPAGGVENFKRDLRKFESWLEGLRGREVNYSGTVFSVKPRLTMDPSRNWRRSFCGFLIVFAKGFVNMVHLEDFCYLRVSGRTQERYRFRRGDRLDFFARLNENRGRVVLSKINRVEIEERAEGVWWNENRARVALKTGSVIDGQPEKCLQCENGCLVDVVRTPTMDTGARRRLFCLEGVKDPGLCHCVKIEKEAADGCRISECGPSNKNCWTTDSKILTTPAV